MVVCLSSHFKICIKRLQALLISTCTKTSGELGNFSPNVKRYAALSSIHVTLITYINGSHRQISRCIYLHNVVNLAGVIFFFLVKISYYIGLVTATLRGTCIFESEQGYWKGCCTLWILYVTCKGFPLQIFSIQTDCRFLLLLKAIRQCRYLLKWFYI